MEREKRKTPMKLNLLVEEERDSGYSSQFQEQEKRKRWNCTSKVKDNLKTKYHINSKSNSFSSPPRNGLIANEESSYHLELLFDSFESWREENDMESLYKLKTSAKNSDIINQRQMSLDPPTSSSKINISKTSEILNRESSYHLRSLFEPPTIKQKKTFCKRVKNIFLKKEVVARTVPNAKDENSEVLKKESSSHLRSLFEPTIKSKKKFYHRVKNSIMKKGIAQSVPNAKDDKREILHIESSYHLSSLFEPAINSKIPFYKKVKNAFWKKEANKSMPNTKEVKRVLNWKINLGIKKKKVVKEESSFHLGFLFDTPTSKSNNIKYKRKSSKKMKKVFRYLKKNLIRLPHKSERPREAQNNETIVDQEKTETSQSSINNARLSSSIILKLRCAHCKERNIEVYESDTDSAASLTVSELI